MVHLKLRLPWTVEDSNKYVINSKPKGSTDVNKEYLTEKFKAKVDDITTKVKKAKGKDIGVEHPFDWELLESAYISVPLIQGAIDKHVDFVLGSEFQIDTKNKGVQKKFDEFIRKQDFAVLLRLIVRDMLVFGSSFLEIVWGANKVKQLKVIDSKTMYVRRDNKGKILGYTQYINDSVDPVSFGVDQIVHFSFNQLGSSPYGTSVLRSLFGDGNVSIVHQFLSMEDAMKKLLQKQVNAKLHVKVGNDMNHPTQGDIDSLATTLESAKNDTEWITSYLVDMNIMGYEGKILDLGPFINHYEDQMVFGLQTPYVLLGKGRVPEGLAMVQLEAFERRINSIQLAVSRALENKIFDALLGEGKYLFVWNRHERKELDELNILIRFLAEKFILSPQTRNVIENRIRNILGTDNLDFNEYLKTFEDEQTRKATDMKRFNDIVGVPEEEDDVSAKPKDEGENNGSNKPIE